MACAFLAVAVFAALRIAVHAGAAAEGAEAQALAALTLAAMAAIAVAMLGVAVAPERWPMSAARRGAMLALAAAIAAALGLAIAFAPAALPLGRLVGDGGATAAPADALLAAFLAAAAIAYVRGRRSLSLPTKLLIAQNLLFAAGAASLAFLSRGLDAGRLVAQLYEIAGAYLIYRAIVVCFIRYPYQRLCETEQSNRALATAAQDGAARFRDYAHAASDWFWETGPDHRYTFGSQRAGTFNYPPEQFIGRCRWDLAADRDEEPEKWRAHRDALDRHEPFRDFVYRVEPRHGLHLHIAASGTPMFDAAGRFQGYRGATRDVTERVHIEDALRLSEARFRDYAETASDWFWETGPDHAFTFISEGAESAGFNPGARVGQRRIDADTAEPSDPKWRDHMALLERHEPFRDFVYEVARRDGNRRFVSISGKPMFDDNGAFVGYRGGAPDVTDMVRAEQALREAKAAAEKASRAKRDFLANMSHELRTPLNAIIGFSEIMTSGVLKDGEERYRAYAANILDSGRHLLAIVNDLLDVARIEAGRMKLSDDVFAPGDVLLEAERMIREQALAAGLTLVLETRNAPPRVRADRLALRQIILNLLSNAVKFTPHGGCITATVGREITGGIVIAVADNGIGIDADDIPSLMQPFSQVASVYSRKHQGAGLGLMLVRSMVELHGGTVTLESAKGVGTTVTVRLPAERNLNGVAPAAAPAG